MSKKRKLDILYDEFDNEYKDKSEEDMTKIISDLEKEVYGKEESLVGLEGEKLENLQKDVEQGKKRLQNLKGYTKNHTQIEGIRKYKESLEKKVEKEIKNRDENKKLFERTLKELSKVTTKLSDEKYTKKLDQYQYNDLLEKKAKLEEDFEVQSRKWFDSKSRVVELKGKINKCNMAWKTLFVNKDWDDIHAIALSDTKRFSRKIDENENVPLSANNREKQNIQYRNNIIGQPIMNNVENIIDEEEPKALIERRPGFFRRMWNKFVAWLKGEDEYIKSEDINTKENESKDIEKEKSVNVERDAFLEGLRQHVDVEYRKAVKEEKTKQEKESHSKQSNINER